MVRSAGRLGDGVVDHVGIDLRLAVRVVAAIGQHLPLRRIAQIGEAHVIELQIPAARVVQRLNALAIRRGEIGVELFQVRIDARHRSACGRRGSAASMGWGW